jgi:2'-5' RNA ligase
MGVMYYTVAFPDLSKRDAEFIRGFRDSYDVPYRDVIGAHFTLVFGCEEIEEGEYLRHVEAVADQFTPVAFCCRYAMLGADAEDDTAYVFLVPDEGHGAISLLHDELYRGPLAPYLRLDIPFTPHITIATLADRNQAKQLCDDLNASGIEVAGQLKAVTLGKVEGGVFHDVAAVELKG